MISVASSCSWRRRLAVAVFALVSGTAGWVLGHSGQDGSQSGSANDVPGRMAAESSPFETRVASAAAEPAADRAVPVYPVADNQTAVPSAFSCEPGGDGDEVLDVARFERTLAEGTETERHAALTAALQSGFDVPPPLLQRTYVNDLSESVRLLAFKAYVDSISDNRKEVRDMLESGVYDMSDAVQAEARHRLTELERYEFMLATVPSQGY